MTSCTTSYVKNEHHVFKIIITVTKVETLANIYSHNNVTSKRNNLLTRFLSYIEIIK